MNDLHKSNVNLSFDITTFMITLKGRYNISKNQTSNVEVTM